MRFISFSHISRAVTLMNLGQIDVIGILAFILVNNNVAFVIVALTNQPAKNARFIVGIANPTLICFAIPSRDVVLGDGPPKHIFWISGIAPPLDAREKAFDAWPVTSHIVRYPVNGTRLVEYLMLSVSKDPSTICIFFELRHQILCTREDKNIAVRHLTLTILIAGQAFVC